MRSGEPPDRSEGGPALLGGAARGRRVLVVEDDVGLCDAIGRLARGLGAEVWQAQTLDDGLRLLERTTPDLVIADLRLAGRSSFPLIEAAVRRRPTPGVVAMSGQASAEESFRLGQLGVHAYLAKPFASDALIAAMKRAEDEAPVGSERADGAGATAVAASFGASAASARRPGFGSRLLWAARRGAVRVFRCATSEARRRRRRPGRG